MLSRPFAGAACAAFAVSSLSCAVHPPLDVAEVELERFQGTWYEILKLPRATQRNCVATRAFYRLKSATELDVYNECREGSLDGPLRRIGARAVVTDEEEPAKLALDFGGHFGDFWIVEIAGDYEHAAIGHPSRDYLWILSRAPIPREAELAPMLARLRAKAFDVDRLERTQQASEARSDSALESLPSPSDHGCSVAGTYRPTSTPFAAAFGALLGLLGRRNRRRLVRTALGAAASFAILLRAAPLHASTAYPRYVKDVWRLPNEPACTLCHATTRGGNGTITTEFGRNLERRGARGGDPRSLSRALVAAYEAGQDSDEDGVSDFDELRGGTDPNLRGDATPVDGAGGTGDGDEVLGSLPDLPPLPVHGCSVRARGAGASSETSAARVSALLALLAASRIRLRFRSVLRARR